MNKNLYCFQLLAGMIVCLCVPAKSSVALHGEPLREVSTLSDFVVNARLIAPFPSTAEMRQVVAALVPPEFSPEPINPYPDQTDIGFTIDNRNPDSNTEIYRSESETSGFALIATIPGSQEAFFDRNLKPRTFYYYRLRAVRGEEVSDFSETGRFRTNSKNYPPELMARAVDENTIELTLHDRSYNDIGYTIRETSPGNSFGAEVSFPTDSGGTLVLIHEPVNPGTQYYAVDMQTVDEGLPTLRGITSASVTTPLASPEFSPEPVYYEENNVAFIVDNNNGGGSTEIYRSLGDTTAFELVATIPYNQEEAFFDTNLERHSYYYYKLRATWNGQVSAFSEAGKFRSWAKNYPPTLTARAVDENTIELTLKDNSYNDMYYTINGTGFLEDGIQFETDSGATRVFIHEPVNMGTTYSYSVDVTTFGDGSPQHRNVAQATVTTSAAASCSGTGSIKWEVWTNESGTEISSVDYYKSPDHTTSFTLFESSRYYGNNYGSRMSGYVCPPVTGSYTFWIASDDRGELWLSTDDDPIKKVKIASVSGYVPYRNWSKYPAQQSAPVTLEAGRRYYIEALHKENGGDDYISVGWQLPDGTLERPIPGNRLIPFGNPENTAPAIIMHEPVEGQEYTEPAEVYIFTTPSPQDSGIPISKVIFYRDTTILYEDTTSPFQYSWSPATEGTYTITAKVVDEEGGSNMAHATIRVNPPSCSDETGGYIEREIWTNIPGTSVSDIPVDTDYDALQGLSGFETQTYYANNYGSRIRAQVCVPVTGNYVFWIASDDNSELWLSTTDDPYGSKVKIASVTGATRVREWTKYATQQSAPVLLRAGYRYYIEALHKEANGNDHVEVGWQLPDGTLERPIPASRLIMYSEYSDHAVAMTSAGAVTGGEEKDGLELYPNPARHEVALTISGDGVPGLSEAQVQVIAATGEVVHTETVKCAGGCTNTTLMLPDHVNPGVYMVNVIMGRKRLSKKLMVK